MLLGQPQCQRREPTSNFNFNFNFEFGAKTTIIRADMIANLINYIALDHDIFYKRSLLGQAHN